MSAPPLVFISAGEVSGDRHGAAVARELRRRLPDVRLRGLGGPEMADEGVHLLADLEDLAVMGFLEVAKRLRFFRDLQRRVQADLIAEGADLVLPIDYPGFNIPLARFASQSAIPVLFYIAPQVWAWKERRAEKLASYCDRVLTVLPFEDELLRSYGVDSRFVGHPLLDERPVSSARSLSPGGGSSSTLGLFPGSREQEVERILPAFAAAASIILARRPHLDVAIARAAHIREELYADAPFPRRDAAELIREADVALTKSGTITLELALADTPMVVGYRTGRVTYALAKRLVSVPSIALANLVAGENVVPEYIQDDATPERLAAEVETLLDDGPARTKMLDGLKRVRSALGEPGAAGRVAEHAVELLA